MKGECTLPSLQGKVTVSSLHLGAVSVPKQVLPRKLYIVHAWPYLILPNILMEFSKRTSDEKTRT